MSNPPEFSRAPARKALGQHFLFDPDILRRTALAAGPVANRTVIEIGPGPGGLTRALLDQGASPLICIEADARFSEALQAWPEAQSGQLNIHLEDARRIDWETVITAAKGETPAMIIANLPYNVGTPLLVDWLKAGPWRGEMALMFQKEVAERVCAEPGQKHYGRLAVLAAAVCRSYISFVLPPGAFKPPPKVDSAVVVLQPLAPNDRFEHINSLEHVAKAAFGQRRKMLRASLKPLAAQIKINATDWLEACEIEPTARAETLSQNDFRALATYYAARTA